jgi:hypothetical protein
MHIVRPDGSLYAGYAALRQISRELPLFFCAQLCRANVGSLLLALSSNMYYRSREPISY